MTVKTQEGMLPVPLEIVGAGVTFSSEWRGDGVELEVEYDNSTWAGPSTATRYITISREDWDAIIAHVAEQRVALNHFHHDGEG